MADYGNILTKQEWLDPCFINGDTFNAVMTTHKRYKHSKQRESLLRVLKATSSHPTASWLYDQLKNEFPSLSLGTVYRNLSILQEQGLIQVLHSGSSFDHFDADIRPHYHFHCISCGKIQDVAIPADTELDKKVASLLKAEVSGHRMDFYGYCAECTGNHQ